MTLEKLQKDMIAAMKARDKERKDSISSLVSAVKKVGIDNGCRDNIPEDIVDSVILKEIKSVKEQIDTCPADRTDLLEQYKARYDVFNEYAPKLLSEEQMNALVAAMDGKPGDLLLFAADKTKIVWTVLGALRCHLAELMGLVDKNVYRFVWITEFPLLEWSDEENRFTAMHHPFTMPMEEDLQYIDSDPGRVRAKAYDIVLNGNEIGGGSVRIHQDDIQEKMFECLGFTKAEAHERFGFLLDAFKYGVPPHAGLAYGLDRLAMLMAKQDSIRDVIAFPKIKDASCLLTDAPSPVDDIQLKELGILVEKDQKEEEQ